MIEIEKNNILKELNVLLVDDDEEFLSEFESILKFFFKNVITSCCPVEAIGKLKNDPQNVDLIITDIRMPKMNGIDFCREVRSFNKNIPIYVCSTHIEVNDILSLIKINLVDYIVKPITFEKLSKSFQLLAEKLDLETTKFIISNNKFYDKKNKTIIENNQITYLTNKESLLLELLLKNHGHVVSIEKINDFLYEGNMTERAYINLIYRLRKKINSDLFITKREIGLILKKDE